MDDPIEAVVGSEPLLAEIAFPELSSGEATLPDSPPMLQQAPPHEGRYILLYLQQYLRLEETVERECSCAADGTLDLDTSINAAVSHAAMSFGASQCVEAYGEVCCSASPESLQQLEVRVASGTSAISFMLPLLAGHNARVFDLAFSPADSDRFATASEDGSAKVKPIGCLLCPPMVICQPLLSSVFCCRFGSTAQSTRGTGSLPPFTAIWMPSCV